MEQSEKIGIFWILNIKWNRDPGRNMSNKLIKNSVEATSKRINIVRVIAGIMTVFFILIWSWIGIVSHEKKVLLNSMVEGTDYYVEEVRILKKECYETAANDSSSSQTMNYYLYYGEQWDDKLLVDRDIFDEYHEGDTIAAYTIDHKKYALTLDSLLINNTPRYHYNEIYKAIGVLLGSGIALILMEQLIEFKLKDKR